jgi:catechol 2,3-dioxygenase-like lactoylglutathione lyase family enzyme
MFYIDVLGLKPVTVEQLQTYDMLDEGWRRLYEMRPGDVYYGTTVDPPYSGDTPDRMFSGRLLLRRVPGHVKTDNLMHRSRPGSLGYSLFTYRVTDLNAWYIRVASSDATGVTEVMKNEFGELSFSFVAPDGCFWNLIGSEE